MIAAHHAEVPARVRELTFLDVLYPGTKHADRNLIFFFACHRAGMTPDTSILVEYKAISHEKLCSFLGAIPQLASEAAREGDPCSRWLGL